MEGVSDHDVELELLQNLAGVGDDIDNDLLNMGTLDTSKRRSRNPSEWQREKRKRLRVAGKEYVNSRGDVVGAKSIGRDCKCRKQCYEKVSEADRDGLFQGYYSLKSHDEQNAYLYGLIRKHDISRKRNKTSNRRTCTYRYFVRLAGKEVQICRQAFANIHGISAHKIRILCQKMDMNIMFPTDGRGKHDNRPKKISPQVIEHVKKHICSVVKSDRLDYFLKEDKNNSTEVNITKLWRDYLRKFDPKYKLYVYSKKFKNRLMLAPTGGQREPLQTAEPLVKHWLYSKVFHENFDVREITKRNNSVVKPRKKPIKKVRNHEVSVSKSVQTVESVPTAMIPVHTQNVLVLPVNVTNVSEAGFDIDSISDLFVMVARNSN